MPQCLQVGFIQALPEKQCYKHESDGESETDRQKRPHRPHRYLAEQKRACSQSKGKSHKKLALPFVHFKSFIPIHSFPHFKVIRSADDDLAAIFYFDLHAVLYILKELIPQ